MPSWKNWVIDASMSEPRVNGQACFCPIEGDLDGEYAIVTGLSIFTDKVPHDGKCVAIVHDDGQEAVEAWCERNAEWLDDFKRRAPGAGEGGGT